MSLRILGFEELVEGLGGDAQQLRGAGLDIAAEFHGPVDHALFHGVEERIELETLAGVRQDGKRIGPQRLLETKIVGLDRFGRSEHRGLLEHAVEFADVAGPRIADQLADGRRRKALLVLMAGVPCRQHVGGQQGDVGLARTQRRDRDAGAEPLIEILAEGAGHDHFPEIAVGGGDDPQIHFKWPRRTNRLDFPLIENPQEFCLGGKRKFADFIKEKDPSVGRFEFPLMVGSSSGERTLAVAEQLAFHEVFRDAAAVHRHQRTGGPRTEVMEELGEVLLAAAGLAQQQKVKIVVLRVDECLSQGSAEYRILSDDTKLAAGGGNGGFVVRFGFGSVGRSGDNGKVLLVDVDLPHRAAAFGNKLRRVGLENGGRNLAACREQQPAGVHVGRARGNGNEVLRIRMGGVELPEMTAQLAENAEVIGGILKGHIQHGDFDFRVAFADRQLGQVADFGGSRSGEQIDPAEGAFRQHRENRTRTHFPGRVGSRERIVEAGECE